jgi:hypothetical protein
MSFASESPAQPEGPSRGRAAAPDSPEVRLAESARDQVTDPGTPMQGPRCGIRCGAARPVPTAIRTG